MKTSKILKSAIRYVSNPSYRFLINNAFGFHKNMSDEEFLSRTFSAAMGRPLNLNNPQTFNEKLQWLKLYNRNPEYTMMVDKYRVREYIADKLGEEYLIPLLGVWDDPDDIDFDALPSQFVLKCNHNSGLGMCICKDKSKLDIRKTRTELRKGLQEDYYIKNREWPYKDVPRKIIAEKYMEDKGVNELRDYKFFCFNGVCKCMKVDFDRFVQHRANYYDPQGNLLNFGEVICPPDPNKNICLPQSMDKMIEFAEKLSKEQPFLRTDFYDVNGNIYFGELTFFPASGMGKFIPDEWDYKLGEWLELPETLGGGYFLLIDDLILFFKYQKTVDELKDYKLWCFNGNPQITLVCTERFTGNGLHEDFFDMDWNHLALKRPNSPCSEVPIGCPENYQLMKKLARKVSADIPFVRVDFYEIGGRVYFGEMTFFPASGFEPFEPDYWDTKLGEMIELTEKKANNHDNRGK